ncbi:hypothetical protein HXX76_010481 [Chlamydomonas incerta]|uniref:Methyltransferase FkbM domain-containing protein n=1 Tax=Chlamydomonas incerta TaxID=51695 RepID=A0A835SJT7_CHLIN|nr:hypothetical protein HXX76_010481 [Chlamydomonas incerta]|eukprot:KAG2428334.1 hypothetical protein HXX76_010481 [Chlamydomonas incerta]
MAHKYYVSDAEGCGVCRDCEQGPQGEQQRAAVAAAAGRPLASVDVHCFEPSWWHQRALKAARDQVYGSPGAPRSTTDKGAAGGGTAVRFNVLPYAVSNATGVTQFPANCTSELCNLEAGSLEGETWVDVNVTTVDDYVRRNGIDKIDILKIDTEGFDPTVLAGAYNTLLRHKAEVLSFEYHHYWTRSGGTLPMCLDYLEQLGYSCYFDGPKLHRLTGCWDPGFEIKDWSNVVCAVRGSPMEGRLAELAILKTAAGRRPTGSGSGSGSRSGYFEAGRTPGSSRSVGVWVGRGVLTGARVRDLLSAALSSPLPDWRQKLDWLLARCEGYPQALQAAAAAAATAVAAEADGAGTITPSRVKQSLARIKATPEAFRISASQMVMAPEPRPDGDEDGDGEEPWGEAAGGQLAELAVRTGAAGGSNGNRNCDSSRNSFSARLAALHERGLVVTFRECEPECWATWDPNSSTLITLYGRSCPQLQLTPALLERACRQRCLRVLRAVLRHAGQGVFRPEHASMAAGGERRPPGSLPVDDGRAFAVMDFFDRLGLLPPQPRPAAAAGPCPAPAGATRAGQHPTAAEQEEQQQPEAGAVQASAEQQQWGRAMTDAVMSGNGLRFVAYLHTRCGAVPDLWELAATGGCSVEVLEWAVRVLRGAGRELPEVTEAQVLRLCCGGNPPAAAWALRRLAAPLPSLEMILAAVKAAPGQCNAFPNIGAWLRLTAWLLEGEPLGAGSDRDDEALCGDEEGKAARAVAAWACSWEQ